MITDLPLLTAEGSDDVRERVYALREHWIARGGDPPAFLTLGTPSYLDVAERPETGHYQRHGVGSRELLRTHFEDLYDRLGKALTDHLDAPVRFPEHLALPGFHIWLEDAIFTRPQAPVHFDLQYQAFDWPPGTDTDRLLSFTLPLRVPAAGGGLNLWEATYQDFRRSLARGWVESAADLQRFHPLRYVPYTPGHLYVHSGHVLHQVAPSSSVRRGDERLTLQGHGVWCDGRWLLYW
ncbi:hypothetical protein ACIRU3_33505 [Streptomyces sp. NPDC101151]|uniref:hypothetical protein n=1 Tax=Streptomyces sp. NPDC101151 TaxID=3366115 RepID=UPI0038264F03